MSEEEPSLEERIKVSLNFFSALALFLFIFIVPVFLIFMSRIADKYKYVKEGEISGFSLFLFNTVNFLKNNYYCTFSFLFIIVVVIILIQAYRKNFISKIKNYVEAKDINYPTINFINTITLTLFLLIILVTIIIFLLPIIQLMSSI